MRTYVLPGAASLAGLLMSGAALGDITIGVARPLAGPYAATDAQFKECAEQAVEDINAVGDINGERLVIELGDDVSEPVL